MFELELNNIQNEEIRQNCKQVLDKVNESFYKVAASSTGKYHPSYTLGEGGLYRHTCAAFRIGDYILSLETCDEFTNDEKDYIRAAIILHDCCKHGKDFTNKYTVHQHPNLAKELIEETLGECEFSTIVGKLVSTHMGQWNTCSYNSTILSKPVTAMEKFVHYCDYLASRKDLEVLFD